MSKKKSRPSRVSKGGRQKSNVAYEAKRQARFAAKREAGNAYVYEKNPYKKGTNEYERERLDRAEKAKSSRLPIAIRDSITSKVDAWVAEDKEKRQKSKKNKKAAAA